MRLVLDENLAIAAGAGTGKTHALVTVALGLYAGAGGRAPLDPGRVWAVTFTEKAAAELLGRIAARVRVLARGGADAELAAILDGEAPRARWEEVARALAAAPIGTFHGLCGQLLRRHAAEARLDPRFAILDENAAAELLVRAREEALVAALGDGGDAIALVRALGSLEAVRGALTQLHHKLAEEGREARTVAGGPPFDRAAAEAELARAGARLAVAVAELAAVGHERLRATVETARREAGRLARFDPGALADWYPACAAIDAAPRGGGSLPVACKAPWERFREAWRAAQRAVAAVGQAEAGRALAALGSRVDEAYRAAKRERRALDFADLIRNARDLLRDDLAVRREAKARVGALLVDEFQDVNRLQLDLCHLLGEARDGERPVGDGGCAALPLADAVLCAVGDRKQSIYEFRGADVSVFGELLDRARRGDGMRLETLQRSYRSRPPLVAFANDLFAEVLAGGDDDAPYRVRWVAGEDALTPARSDGEATPAIEILDCEARDHAAERRPLEAERVARRVARLLAGGVAGGDVAVLLRAFTGVEVYRRALTRRGVPTVLAGGQGFHGAREVRDLAALLAALADPGDRFASAAVYRSPAGGLSDDALLLLAHADALPLSRHARGPSVPLPREDEARLGRLGRLVARLAPEVDRVGPGRALAIAVEELDLLPSLAASFDGEQRIANLRKLLGRLDGAGGSAADLAARLLAAADAADDREPPADVAGAADPRAVRILTVHAAKGLEFPVVVVPELGASERSESAQVLYDRRLGLAVKPVDPLGARVGDAHFDAVLAELNARRDAESARLLYVAATRARDLLILCGERGRGASWRALVDRALPSVSVPIARPPADPDEARAPSPEPILTVEPSAAARAQLACAEAPPVGAPRLVAAVTDLAAFDRCARRYFYRALVGLEEYLQSGTLLGAAADEDASPLDRLARGTLAHLLLERADLALPPSEAVRRAAAAEGLDAAAPDVAPIAADATAFLDGDLGRRLATAPRVYRELPFALEVAGRRGATLVVKGKIDLLFVDGEGAINVVDYKHASAKGQPRDAFAFQLRTYALAARRVLDPKVPLRAGVAWLRDRGPAAPLTPVDDAVLQAHAARLAVIAERLVEAQRADAWPKLPSRTQCEGCGYVPRCWGRGKPEQLALFPG